MKKLFGLRFKHRKKSGAIMAASELMVIIPTSVLLMFLLLNTAVVAVLKIKLSAIAQDSAKLVADSDISKESPAYATHCVESLLKSAGQHYSSVKVKMDIVKIVDATAVTITIDGKYPLIQSNLLPADLSIRESATALIPTRKIYGYVAIKPFAYTEKNTQKSAAIYCPIIRPSQKLPVWTFPYDTAIGSLYIEKGQTPESKALATAAPNNNNDEFGIANYFQGIESIY